jgi:hypothetical protein
MMPPTAKTRRAAPGRPGPDPAALLAGLLAEHERAAAAGRPLLTDAGAAQVRHLLAAGPAVVAPPAALPHWDGAARRLWLGGRLLKEFRRPAPRQIAILAAFEEEGWAAGRVDDPLPPHPGDAPGEARRRLHETVHNLNQTLPPGTIRFRGDGTGEGVRWEPCPAAAGPPAINRKRNTRNNS